MGSTVNSIYLIGTLRRDPEKTSNDDGALRCMMEIVTRDTYTNRESGRVETPETHAVIASGGLAETCLSYLSEGRQVYVEGSLHTRIRKENGVQRKEVEIRAREVTFLGRRRDTDTLSDRRSEASSRNDQRDSKKSVRSSSESSSTASDLDLSRLDDLEAPQTCDWCARPVSYSDGAYDLCSNCSDQMLRI